MTGRLLTPLVAVTAAAALAGASLAAGSGTRSAACALPSWPASLAGLSTHRSSTNGQSVFVWQSGASWHLAIVGTATAAPLVGHVVADAPLRITAANPSLRSGVATTPRTLSFKTDGSGTLVFRADCAKRVSFSFGASIRPTDNPRVYVGRAARSPGSSFAVSRPATTGLTGHVYQGLGCPVQQVGTTCGQRKPAQTTVELLTVPATKTGSASGQVVATTRSATDGSFGFSVAPGRYLLRPVLGAGVSGTPAPIVVNVVAGVVTQADVFFDNGIR
jgi:hypothetical protein